MAEVDCNGCGLCCMNQPCPPFCGDGDPSRAECPPELLAEIEAYIFSSRYNESHPCFWLDGYGRCRHYEHRPEICRDYEVGGESCLAERKRLIQITPARSV